MFFTYNFIAVYTLLKWDEFDKTAFCEDLFLFTEGSRGQVSHWASVKASPLLSFFFNIFSFPVTFIQNCSQLHKIDPFYIAKYIKEN